MHLCCCRTSATPCMLYLLMWEHTACSPHLQNRPHHHLRQLHAPAEQQQPATAQKCPQKQPTHQAAQAQVTLPVRHSRHSRHSSLQLCRRPISSQPTASHPHCRPAATQAPQMLQTAAISVQLCHLMHAWPQQAVKTGAKKLGGLLGTLLATGGSCQLG